MSNIYKNIQSTQQKYSWCMQDRAVN